MKNNKGSTLLEALIALAAIVIILTAVSALVLTSLNNSTFSKDQNQSNKLAQQGIEYIKEKVSSKSGFDQYTAVAGSVQCMKDISSATVFVPGVCDNTGLINNTYKREVIFTSNSADCNPPGGSGSSRTLKATVTVYWQSGKCSVSNPFCHNQQVTSCYINPSKLHPTGI